MAETTSLTIDCDETVLKWNYPNNLAAEYTLMHAKIFKLHKLLVECIIRAEEMRFHTRERSVRKLFRGHAL